MNKFLYQILIFLLITVTIVLPQQSRLNALGGLSYSIIDSDSKLDPYILGNNPAWLVNSQISQRLEISPSYDNTYGNYHRYYDSDNIHNFNVGFVGIKPLGTNGTFKGSAFYDYQLQKNRNRTLTLETYSGDAFFFVDTTAGDFRYNGPTFEFMHSLKLYDKLYFGASVRYKILDGLKKIFSYAQSLYRNVSGNIGLAYNFSDKITLGFHYTLFDAQERIEAKDINLLTVKAFMYRGETYRVDKSGTSPDYKIKKAGQSFNFQIYSQQFENFIMGISAKYFLHNSKVILRDKSLLYEDGYSSYNSIDVNLETRWLINNFSTLGFTTGYFSNNSWSKNSTRNLLLWEWNIDDKFVGFGGTVKILNNKLLLGAEYELHSISTDSSKYIDNKSSEINGINNIIRFGSEYYFSDNITLRFGYNLFLQQYDFIYGGSDLVGHKITTGLKYVISNKFEIDSMFRYQKFKVSKNDLLKTDVGIFLTLRFFTF